jgi:hypothetical protein
VSPAPDIVTVTCFPELKRRAENGDVNGKEDRGFRLRHGASLLSTVDCRAIRHNPAMTVGAYSAANRRGGVVVTEEIAMANAMPVTPWRRRFVFTCRAGYRRVRPVAGAGRRRLDRAASTRAGTENVAARLASPSGATSAARRGTGRTTA